MEYSLFGMNREALAQLMPTEPPFRSKQLFEYLYSRREERAPSLQDCSVLPRNLRNSFSLPVYTTRLYKTVRDEEGVVKYRIVLHSGEPIEAVVLVDRAGRRTACLSSQAGCKMGCRFCTTASLGFSRNLSVGEILEQLKWIESDSGAVQNIVFMGMGEPLDNLESVIGAISILTDERGFGLGRRRITLSTCGLADKILQLSEARLGVRLAVSLNSALSPQRKALMPIEGRFPLNHLKESLVAYQKACGNKRITLEYVMMKETNLSLQHAKALIDFAKGLKVLVNLIPLNRGDEIPFEVPTEGECAFFEKQLTQAGLNVTRRKSKGRSIRGACGQLAAQTDSR